MHGPCFRMLAACAVLVLLMGCRQANEGMQAAALPTVMAIAQMTPSELATTQPVNNNVTGTVNFTQMGDKVLVAADVTGLEPNTRYAIYIHQNPDLSDPALMSAGARWNPDAGDLGDFDADENGHANLEVMVSDISVGGVKHDVIGHAVIIHAKGARISGGIIELKSAPN
jgi:superoxide dismutase, Cu-Zn family